MLENSWQPRQPIVERRKDALVRLDCLLCQLLLDPGGSPLVLSFAHQCLKAQLAQSQHVKDYSGGFALSIDFLD